MEKESKNKKVFDYMKTHDYITSMDAIENFKATRLSSIIFDMRRHGIKIRTEMIPNSDSVGSHARYYLEK